MSIAESPSSPFADWLDLLEQGQADSERLQEQWERITPTLLVRELAFYAFSAPNQIGKLAEQAMQGDTCDFLTYVYRGTIADPIRGKAVFLSLMGFLTAGESVAALRNGRTELASRLVRRCADFWRASLTMQSADAALALPIYAPEDIEPSENLLSDGSKLQRQIVSILSSWLARQEQGELDALARNSAAIVLEIATALFLAVPVPEKGEENGALPIRDERRVRILYFGSDIPHAPEKGHTARLRVEAIPLTIRTDTSGEAAAFYPNPLVLGLAPLSQRFIEAAVAAGDAAARLVPPAQLSSVLRPQSGWAIRWHVEEEDGSLQNVPILMGASLGAALAVALVQLRSGELIDEGFAVTGALGGATDEDTRLLPVAYVREKCAAALSLRSDDENLVTRVAVPQENAPEAAEGARRANRNSDTAVVACATLRACIQTASQQAHRIREGELRTVLSTASGRLRRPIESITQLAELCAPPRTQVLRGSGALENSVAQPPQPWESVSHLLRGQRTAIVGEPGAGKTMLLLLETARNGRMNRENPSQPSPTNDREPDFAVYLRAGQIYTEMMQIPDAADRDFRLLKAVAGAVAKRHNLPSVAMRWTQRQFEVGNALLVVDAVDEMEETSGTALLAALSDQAKATPYFVCIVAARPTRVDSVWNSHADWESVRLRLSEFDRAQMQQAISVWFAGTETPQAGGILWRAIESRPDLRGVLQIPLHLHIVCRHLQQSRTIGGQTELPRRRSDIYALLMQDSLDEWSRRMPFPTEPQRIALADFAGETAFLLYERGDGESAWPVEWFRDAINQLRPSYDALRGRVLLDDLQNSGLITAVEGTVSQPSRRDRRRGVGEAVRFGFRHQTIASYLLGTFLAQRVEREGWSTVQELLQIRLRQPLYQEAIPFLAASLDDPLPLLNLLTDAKGDNRARHRLLLAAQCLPEIFPSGLEEA